MQDTIRMITNIVFTVIVSVFLLGVIAFKVSNELGVAYPEGLGIGESKSMLEGRNYKRPTASINTISNGEFQSQAEQYLSDIIPMHDSVLISIAGVERFFISCANVVPQYDVYPTYFGSGVVFCDSADLLLEMPRKATEKTANAFHNRADYLNELFGKYPSMRFFVYSVPYGCYMDDSPVASLVTQHYNNSFVQNEFLARFTNATVVDSSISFDEYCSLSFKTDHHWNTLGGYEAYTRMAKAMGFDDFVQHGDLIAYDEPFFYGSTARTGRILEIHDLMVDYDFDLGDLQATGDGQDAKLEHSAEYRAGDYSHNALRNRYGEYFHTDYRELRITNVQADSDKTLLLVANSYSSAIERLFTKHYSTVIAFDCRKDAPTLAEYLDSHPEVDDVVLLFHPAGFLDSNLVR